jgi:hypothetical protein
MLCQRYTVTVTSETISAHAFRPETIPSQEMKAASWRSPAEVSISSRRLWDIRGMEPTAFIQLHPYV